MNITTGQRIVLGIAILIILIFALGALGVIPIFKDPIKPGEQPVALTFWGIDEPSWITPLINSYRASSPNVKIEYKQIDEKNYESSLLNAMATNQAPDIIMFHRSWVMKNGDKVTPAGPDEISVTQIRQFFPDIIEKDFVYGGYVFALPLYLDNLALFYNKDIFNARGISLTPKTWSDFRNLTSFLTEYDLSHKIKKSGAAIGGSRENIETAPDILALLMLQRKSAFVNSQGDAVSNEAAQQSLNFYFDFINTSSPYYIWSEELGNYLDAFASGKTAMIFDYARRMPVIKQKNPFLNFEAAVVPQFDNADPKNCVDYWGLAVTKQSKNSATAWSFIRHATANTEASEGYLKVANLPPALRVLINKYQNEPTLNVFAKQSLTSSFYSINQDVFRNAFGNAIKNFLNGKMDSNRALQQAVAEINANK